MKRKYRRFSTKEERRRTNKFPKSVKKSNTKIVCILTLSAHIDTKRKTAKKETFFSIFSFILYVMSPRLISFEENKIPTSKEKVKHASISITIIIIMPLIYVWWVFYVCVCVCNKRSNEEKKY